MYKLSSQHRSSAALLSLALFSCSGEEKTSIQTPEFQEQRSDANKVVVEQEASVEFEDLSFTAPKDSPTELVSDPLAPIRDKLEHWHSLASDGTWIVSMEEREEVYSRLKHILGIQREVFFDLEKQSESGSVLSASDEVHGEIFISENFPDVRISFQLNTSNETASLIDWRYSVDDFPARFENVCSHLLRIYADLKNQELICGSPQRALENVLYVPILSYLRGRAYPALVLPAKLNLESGDLEIPTAGREVRSFLKEVSESLGHLRFFQGEVFMAENESSRSRVRVTNDWPASNGVELPQYKLEMDFAMDQGKIFVTNAILDAEEFGELLSMAMRVVERDQPERFEFGFASPTSAVLFLPPEKDSENETALPFEPLLFQKAEDSSHWSIHSLGKATVENDEGEILLTTERHKLRYILGHQALCVDGRWATRLLFGRKRE